jgi:hypothetical protein
MSAPPAVAPYVSVGGRCGLTWAASLRGWMVQLGQGESSASVTWLTFGLPVIAMVGGFAISGRGPVWGRACAWLLFTTGFAVWLLTAVPVGGDSFALDTAHGLWVVSVLYESLLVTFALAASAPHRLAAGPDPVQQPAAIRQQVTRVA